IANAPLGRSNELYRGKWLSLGIHATHQEGSIAKSLEGCARARSQCRGQRCALIGIVDAPHIQDLDFLLAFVAYDQNQRSKGQHAQATPAGYRQTWTGAPTHQSG